MGMNGEKRKARRYGKGGAALSAIDVLQGQGIKTASFLRLLNATNPALPAVTLRLDGDI